MLGPRQALSPLRSATYTSSHLVVLTRTKRVDICESTWNLCKFKCLVSTLDTTSKHQDEGMLSGCDRVQIKMCSSRDNLGFRNDLLLCPETKNLFPFVCPTFVSS